MKIYWKSLEDNIIYFYKNILKLIKMAQLGIIRKDLDNGIHLDYAHLSKKEWNKIVLVLIICAIIALFTLFILRTITKFSRCYLTGIFIVVFFISMLILGDEFMKNVAIVTLAGIILTIILSVFVFLTYDIFACKDYITSKESPLL